MTGTTETTTVLGGADPAAAAVVPPADPAAPPVTPPTDPAKPGDKPADPKPGDKPAVPEKYEFKFEDGVAVDAKALEGFEPIAKELGLSNEQAQKLVDYYVGQNTGWAKAQEDAWQATAGKWLELTKADKEIGGDKLNENVAAIKPALAKVLSGANETETAARVATFMDAMNVSGLGNHPEVLRLLYRVAQVAGDDKFHLGTASGQPKSAAEQLYPTMAKQ